MWLGFSRCSGHQSLLDMLGLLWKMTSMMLIFIEVFSSNRLMSDIKFRQFSLSTLFYDPPYITWMCQPQPDDYQVYVFCGSLLIMSRSKNYRRLSLCFIHADYFRVESGRERETVKGKGKGKESLGYQPYFTIRKWWWWWCRIECEKT